MYRSSGDTGGCSPWRHRWYIPYHTVVPLSSWLIFRDHCLFYILFSLCILCFIFSVHFCNTIPSSILKNWSTICATSSLITSKPSLSSCHVWLIHSIQLIFKLIFIVYVHWGISIFTNTLSPLPIFAAFALLSEHIFCLFLALSMCFCTITGVLVSQSFISSTYSFVDLMFAFSKLWKTASIGSFDLGSNINSNGEIFVVSCGVQS